MYVCVFVCVVRGGQRMQRLEMGRVAEVVRTKKTELQGSAVSCGEHSFSRSPMKDTLPMQEVTG